MKLINKKLFHKEVIYHQKLLKNHLKDVIDLHSYIDDYEKSLDKAKNCLALLDRIIYVEEYIEHTISFNQLDKLKVYQKELKDDIILDEKILKDTKCLIQSLN